MATVQPLIAVPKIEEPIRAELFSPERLEQHAQTLAAAQEISDSTDEGQPLLPRVLENGRVLLEYYRATAQAVSHEQSITPAAEWLVDNFYIVEEQIREIRDDLPPGFYRKLPKLASGHLKGYPRVFGVAWAFVAHTDSRFDPEVLRRFIAAYQSVQPLTIGELWAVAITLRMVLVENLRRIAERIVQSREARQEADTLADSLLGAGGQSLVSPATVLRRFERKPLDRAFAVQLVQRLRDLDPKVGPILLWLDERLAAQGSTAEEIVRAEHQDQAAMSVTVRNIITSMRLTSAFDWQEFFESVSLVDEVLREGSKFGAMDFATRDQYRHAVEDLSRGSKHSEVEVAERAVLCAKKARRKSSTNGEPSDDRVMEPGFYLVSRGRQEFERELGFRVPWRRWVLRLYVRAAVPGYIGTIAVLSAIILAFPLVHAYELGISLKYVVLFGFLGVIPASHLAIALINRVVTDLLGPRTLPRLDLRGGVPKELRTIVVVPTLLTSQEAIKEQVERLEVHYLANSDGDLRFALLSDWTDAPAEVVPGDEDLLAAAANGIAGLNERHGTTTEGANRFYLFHRKRMWNESEQEWMGWERKRGKLHEFNQLLRGALNTTFLPNDERTLADIAGVRYVITLDADTRLPRETASRLVGTMAHPLNRPRFSAMEGRVVEGYGVVQPRITSSLPMEREATLFQKVFSGPSGIDPYAFAVSDVYQDLFREGSYTGKGIYDVDAFEAALAGKVKENTLLSHDLFEGIFARAALATDIELFDDFPSHYEAAAARQHRWARGDWQLLPWIFGRGGLSKEERKKIKLPGLSRWKMFDNLRRTLLAPSMFLTLIAGWLVAGLSPWMWTRFILATISIPALLPFLAGLNARLAGISKRTHIRGVLSDLSLGACQIGLTVTFLAHEAWLMFDAIVRTLVRLFVTHKNLLEWVTAAQAKRKVDLNLFGIYRRTVGSVLLALAAFLVVLFGHRQALYAAVPFVMLWCAAPAVAQWISRPPKPVDEEPLPQADALSLRSISRRTWRFFENFVTEADSWLPPDNFQEDPKPVIAHRTSPTNIGLYLLSTLAARDMGWLGTRDVVDRLEATFQTMGKLELFRGHFYNWYETRDLRPLDPRYVSTVDSGNIAGHLLALANGCRELVEKTSVDQDALSGIEDTIRLLQDALNQVTDSRRTHTVTLKHLRIEVRNLVTIIERAPSDAVSWGTRLVDLRARAQTIADIAGTLAQELGDPAEFELRAWADAVKACVESHYRDAVTLLPWLRLPPAEIMRMTAPSSSQAPTEWLAIEPFFQTIPSLREAPERLEAAIRELETLSGKFAPDGSSNQEILSRINTLAEAMRSSSKEAAALTRRLLSIVSKSEEFFEAMDFTFLYDKTRKLFSIGYRGSDGTLDPNCYDLLASEARLASFIAIAKANVPSAHWFRLGRALTPVGRGSALISWSGSMFEYLMPALVMRSPAESLLRQTYTQIVIRQIGYGNERGVPWGMSESAYNARDLDLTYQYSSFGVPGLGLKRGLSQDLVIAPYATALAAMIDPSEAVENFTKLTRAGGLGSYGFYEALDYTSTRLPEGQDVAIVRAHMAHHQGMSLIALANTLHNGAMQSRFHAEPIVQATELLLQERTPRGVLVAHPRAEEVSTPGQIRELIPPVVRQFKTPHDALPRTQLLSNGRYAVMLTAAGSGYSRWRDIAITRWREDLTRDCWGTYIFLRDEQTANVWSAGYQPSGIEPENYEAVFYEDRAEILRRDRSLTTTLEVVVSSEDDAEVRRVSISNMGVRTRDIQVTSFAELSLATQAADSSHPAFSNLFVETEYVSDVGALLATRRKHSENEPPVWVAHVLVAEAETTGDLQFETDRAKFLGRDRSLRNPISIIDGRPLSNTVGSVLDPAMSLRRTVRVPAGKTVRLTYSTVVASTREEVLALADKYHDPKIFERTHTLAWTQAQVQLRHLGISVEEAHLFQRVANAVLYSDSTLRPSTDVLTRTPLQISTLWGQGISGDLPIVLARIDDAEDVDLIRQLLRAHEYWRMKQLAADVVIINEKSASYAQDLQGSLEALVRGSQLRLSPDTSSVSGRIFLFRGDLVSPETRAQLQSIARVVLLSRRGTLAEQIIRAQYRETTVPPLRPPRDIKYPEVQAPQPNVQFFNGFGGFAEGGREYVTVLGEGLRTPEPWINVIANPSFGFLTSESGSGFTWSLNSHENQLTPWSNDHVTDVPGEAIYIRDESSGEVWSPTALPIRDEGATYVARHGQGYSRFQHSSRGIQCDLVQFVPPEDPIKISRLILQNDSGRARRLSITAYAEWVLGSSRAATAPYIVSELDSESGALFARSLWTGEFGGRIAFADLSGRQNSFTGDRTDFLGRNGGPERPAALEQAGPLSRKLGAGLDPCAALQTTVELRPGTRTEVVFFLGQTENREEARKLLNRYRLVNLNEVFKDTARLWEEVLTTVEVKTPDPSMDLLLNRWLLYQVLSCRVWARAAFYQLSGAYGFRDQLQDVMALAVAKRGVAREHLLRAAARQFVEGDVQHWWHVPSGRGIRTRMSDDLLWLPYAAINYIEMTGDTCILDELVPFLQGDLLAESQKESYFQPVTSESKGTVFEHCARALDRSLSVGSHGLPLIGTGDWNDGMNRVGQDGKGESVWLGWFLHTVLWEFAKVADARGEHGRAEKWRLHVSALKAALEREGWDGDWYRRAYFDDGTPLGSAQNAECRIDSIAQSWGVISGAAERGRAIRAMDAADKQLIKRREGLILLLTPPFDHDSHDPGYIKGYLPGIRENGGQYTHASVWTLIAFAALGDGDKAGELFRMINPINRTNSRTNVQRYKVEPYAVAADIYAEPPHVGRGGWTWYTGAAGWLYRAGIEWILGFRVRGMSFSIDPCIPRDWPSYSIVFRYHSAVYNIKIENPSGVARGVALTELDGRLLAGSASIPLTDDGRVHNVKVVLG
jgi:cyclic beta-1,2-glucan synthetase